MTDLLTRLEQAEKGSRELSDDVLLSCGWRLGMTDDRAALQEMDPDDRNSACWHPPNSPLDWIQGFKRPCPTTSLDAALTLLPKGRQWSIHFYRGGLIPEEPNGWFLGEVDGMSGGVIYEGKSYATPALALCIAALKARQAQERAA